MKWSLLGDTRFGSLLAIIIILEGISSASLAELAASRAWQCSHCTGSVLFAQSVQWHLQGLTLSLCINNIKLKQKLGEKLSGCYCKIFCTKLEKVSRDCFQIWAILTVFVSQYVMIVIQGTWFGSVFRGFRLMHRGLRAQVWGGCSKGVTRHSRWHALCSGAPSLSCACQAPGAAVLGHGCVSRPSEPDPARAQPRSRASPVPLAWLCPPVLLLGTPALSPGQRQAESQNPRTVWAGRDQPVPTPCHKQAGSGCSEQGLRWQRLGHQGDQPWKAPLFWICTKRVE